MFATGDDGKYVEQQVLRALARVPTAIWLVQFMTILSGR
jgi:hypothetical protein